MIEFIVIILLPYIIISMGFGVLEYFMDRKRKNRQRRDGLY
jgi:hypothetical protein